MYMGATTTEKEDKYPRDKVLRWFNETEKHYR